MSDCAEAACRPRRRSMKAPRVPQGSSGGAPTHLPRLPGRRNRARRGPQARTSAKLSAATGRPGSGRSWRYGERRPLRARGRRMDLNLRRPAPGVGRNNRPQIPLQDPENIKSAPGISRTADAGGPWNWPREDALQSVAIRSRTGRRDARRSPGKPPQGLEYAHFAPGDKSQAPASAGETDASASNRRAVRPTRPWRCRRRSPRIRLR